MARANSVRCAIRIEGGLTPHYSVITVRLRCGGEDFVNEGSYKVKEFSFPNGTQGCSIPTAKVGKTISGSDHSRRAPGFRTRIRA